MEEIDNAGVAEEMRKRLGNGWRVHWYGGANQTGSAIYWRDDLVTFEKDLGKHAVNHFDQAHGGDAVMFGGALLAKRGGPRFGFFTGKLTPRTYDGHDDQEKDDEARRLMAWIKDVMSPYASSSRIIAVDQNDFYEGLAFNAFAKSFSTAHDATPTWKSPNTGKWHRYDYVWWDYDGGQKRTGGVVKEEVMGDSGSDHRSVIATVTLR